MNARDAHHKSVQLGLLLLLLAVGTMSIFAALAAHFGIVPLAWLMLFFMPPVALLIGGWLIKLPYYHEADGPFRIVDRGRVFGSDWLQSDTGVVVCADDLPKEILMACAQEPRLSPAIDGFRVRFPARSVLHSAVVFPLQVSLFPAAFGPVMGALVLLGLGSLKQDLVLAGMGWYLVIWLGWLAVGLFGSLFWSWFMRRLDSTEVSLSGRQLSVDGRSFVLGHQRQVLAIEAESLGCVLVVANAKEQVEIRVPYPQLLWLKQTFEQIESHEETVPNQIRDLVGQLKTSTSKGLSEST